MIASGEFLGQCSTLLLLVSNGNRTEWSIIQGVIGRVISNQCDLKLRARLPLNCTTRSPITNYLRQ